MAYIVSIERDQVVAHDERNTKTVITSVAQLDALVGDQPVYFSSSIDFPHDSTANPQTLALVRELCREAS